MVDPETGGWNDLEFVFPQASDYGLSRGTAAACGHSSAAAAQLDCPCPSSLCPQARIGGYERQGGAYERRWAKWVLPHPWYTTTRWVKSGAKWVPLLPPCLGGLHSPGRVQRGGATARWRLCRRSDGGVPQPWAP